MSTARLSTGGDVLAVHLDRQSHAGGNSISVGDHSAATTGTGPT
jgi:hypothetical protein